MAVSPIIPSTVQVRLLWSLAGQGAINVLHGIVPGGFVANQAIANTLGAAIKAAFSTNLGPLFTANCALMRVGIRDMRTANNFEWLDEGAAVGGVLAGEALPPNVALCITLRTEKSGKSFRGRVYLGGWSEQENSATGTALASASSAGVAFLTGVSAAMGNSGMTLAVASRNAEHVVVTRETFHADGTTTVDTLSDTAARAAQSTIVTEVQSRDANWETQRRRTNGRGAPPTALIAVARQRINLS